MNTALQSLKTFFASLGAALRKPFHSVRFWVFLILGVIALLVAYYSLSNRYTPYTTDAYVQAYVVQVAARVEGQVVRVYVEENQAVTKGQLLFEIDARPYEHRIANLEAKLASAFKQVAQMESERDALKAEEARAAAEEAYAQAVFKQEQEIFKQESTTERRYLDALQKYKAAIALRERTRATKKKAEDALAARVGEEHAVVAEVKAQLAEARLNLDWCKITAPAGGFITNLQLREGAYAHVGKPVLTCIDTEQWWVVANYRENCLENIRPGLSVGLTFNTYPGRVFAGTVQSVGWGVGEGQGVPSGDLPAVRNPTQWTRQAQRFQVRIAPDLPDGYPLRVGATASVTIYTSEAHWLNPVAGGWQRVVSWFDYLY